MHNGYTKAATADIRERCGNSLFPLSPSATYKPSLLTRPLIPGSSIKGIFRVQVKRIHTNQIESTFHVDSQHLSLTSGNIILFDELPHTNTVKLVVDMMEVYLSTHSWSERQPALAIYPDMVSVGAPQLDGPTQRWLICRLMWIERSHTASTVPTYIILQTEEGNVTLKSITPHTNSMSWISMSKKREVFEQQDLVQDTTLKHSSYPVTTVGVDVLLKCLRWITFRVKRGELTVEEKDIVRNGGQICWQDACVRHLRIMNVSEESIEYDDIGNETRYKPLSI